MRLALLGFGMIAGSLARALHEREPDGWSVAAWSPRGAGPRAAVAAGVIDRAAGSPKEAIEDAELILLAAPPLACLELLDRLAGLPLTPGVVVTDVASTKRQMVARASALGLPFVGGHPMAGLDASGYEAADPELFVGRPWVIVPGAPGGDERVEHIATTVGARVMRMDAAEHDAAVAAISHLPLVLAAALVEAVAGGGTSASGDPRRLAAGGWGSMTRLARGDVEMGVGILATNADEVVARLRGLRAVVDDWIDVLDNAEPDVDALRARLSAARAALERPPTT